MPRPSGPPTVRLRRLANELKMLRAEAELTREQVQERTGVNPGTLWRIESGQARPHGGTLEALFELYGVAEPRRAELIELTKGARNPGWLRPYKDVIPQGYAAYMSFESDAKAAHNYESLFIPGLLQTEEYARATLLDSLPMVSDEIESHVRTRMERQAILTRKRQGRDPLEFWAVVDEAALRRGVGGRTVMRAQLGQLLDLSERPNITVQVIPFDRGAHPGMSGAFMRLKFGAVAPDIVCVESLAGDIFLESEAEIDRYGLIFDHLRAMALSPRDTSALVATLMNE